MCIIRPIYLYAFTKHMRELVIQLEFSVVVAFMARGTRRYIVPTEAGSGKLFQRPVDWP